MPPTRAPVRGFLDEAGDRTCGRGPGHKPSKVLKVLARR
ncbi:hypothetical protein QFZ75_002064 [Streptomyces sp. V3I8]|nr:hypothetical protein [Streptomyces sp. V3I8]